MKFGEKFDKFLRKEDEDYVDKCTYVDYQRLKRILKNCPYREETNDTVGSAADCVEDHKPSEMSKSTACSSQTCPVCDEIIFLELAEEISSIVGYFGYHAKRLFHLHLSSAFWRYLWRARHLFANEHEALIRKGRHLVNYVAINAIAINKILKKYDKIHCSVKGRNLKSKLQAKHIELLKSPWLIELCAFQINVRNLCASFGEIFPECSCNLPDSDPIISCLLPNSVKLEFSLTCPICLDIVYDPVALGCGHMFCNMCACAGASVTITEGAKSADTEARCPICRQRGMYPDSVHLVELGLLVKRRCKGYWKERWYIERSERLKLAKDHLDLHSRFLLGF